MRVVSSETDCAGAQAPAMSGFFTDLLQLADGQATLRVNPLVRLVGRFDGDRLVAREVIQESVSLPDSIARLATPQDSLDTITYVLTADFADSGFAGEYEIRAPDLRALVREGEGRRCDVRYALEGTRTVVQTPRP